MKNSFSSFLVKKRDNLQLTNSRLALISNISAVYLGEIIKKRKNPPDKKIQYALANALQLNDNDKITFFNLAAKERGEIPVDVYDYLLNSEFLFNKIRIEKNIEQNGNKNEDKKTNK